MELSEYKQIFFRKYFMLNLLKSLLSQDLPEHERRLSLTLNLTLLVLNWVVIFIYALPSKVKEPDPSECFYISGRENRFCLFQYKLILSWSSNSRRPTDQPTN